MKDVDNIAVSQSLIKSLFEYKEDKACGIQFYKQYFEGMLFPSSPVQKLGQWFEYMATGALPKDQLVPLPDKTSKNELTEAYKKMTKQLENWERLKKKYQIKILTKGRKITVYDKSLVPNPIDGTTDLEVELTDYQTGIHYPYVMGDIKTTGLLDNKFDDRGWEIGNLGNKVKLVMQPIHYKFIRMIETETDEEPPFMFFLFSNTNGVDHRIIKFNLDTEANIQQHRVLIQNTVKELHYQLKKGFKPLPEVSRCSKCPLKDNCEFFIDVPLIQEFNYNEI